MITLDDLRSAQERVRDIAVRTPILPMKFSDRKDVFVKCENLQRTGSFKLRGAYNAISRLPGTVPGVTASSSGNHAQGVALAAKTCGKKACIVMLDSSVKPKIEGTKSYGAEVILGGKTSDIIRGRAEKEAAERGFTYVPPFNHPHIIAGQGTVGLEILEDLPDVKAVVVPIGGGGLSSGVAAAVKASRPEVKVFGVEPVGASAMLDSIKAGKLVTLAGVNTIADGLKPTAVGDLTFEHVRKYVDEIVLVSDEEILEAARHLILKEKLVVEPSGAATTAAIRSGKLKLPDGEVVAVISGGNADLPAVLGLGA